MRGLVLGSAGFLGSRLMDALLADGCSVVGVQRNPLSGKTPSNSAIRMFDFRDEKSLKPLLEVADVVYHFAGSATPASGLSDPVAELEANFLANVKLFRQCADSGVKRIIFPSSGGTVYGQAGDLPTRENSTLQPLNVYGVGMVATENMLKVISSLEGLEFEILRLANPYGPGQVNRRLNGFISTSISAALENKELTVWGDGLATRDFIYVDDVIDACVSASKTSVTNQIINIGSGTEVTLNQVIEMIEQELSVKINVRYQSERVIDVHRSSLDINAARLVLDWSPKTNLEQGIRNTIHWLQNHSDR